MLIMRYLVWLSHDVSQPDWQPELAAGGSGGHILSQNFSASQQDQTIFAVLKSHRQVKERYGERRKTSKNKKMRERKKENSKKPREECPHKMLYEPESQSRGNQLQSGQVFRGGAVSNKDTGGPLEHLWVAVGSLSTKNLTKLQILRGKAKPGVGIHPCHPPLCLQPPHP